jgi:DNA gyrase subunit A
MAEDKIINRNIEEEMRTAYIDYSMSVIVARALPDVRDGLKPVHRRVLYAMSELGLASNRPYKKSARIVGEVLGKYHPHGDTAVYDTMVRLAQPWSMRYMMVDGQGNFGSVDGDSPAAMRYTEARLRAIAEEMLADLDKNTVDFQSNFDDSLTEPSVLPAAIPNLLVNGASGIAVGMATNMPPHNLREVIAGTIAYIDNRDITIEELMEYIKAPDFPTGAIIYGMEGVRDAFRTGRGRVVMRAVAHIEDAAKGNKRERIIISEIPYQLNKALLVEKIAELMSDKKIEGIAAVRDESDRDGMRVVVELKREAVPKVVLNQLYKMTSMQMSFGVNNVALVNGRPMTLNLKDMIHHYVDHRHVVVKRRTQYELEQAEARAHILEGLIIALDNLDEVIRLIRASKDADTARTGLISQFGLSEIQAKAILDMRLQRLTGLESDKIRAEYSEILKKIEYYKLLLEESPEGYQRRMDVVKTELQEVNRKFGDERRTQIILSAEEFKVEDMIPNEEVVITVSRAGYVKRTVAKEYRAQKRGGKGHLGAGTRDEDFVEQLFIASTHNYMMFFTEKGKCFWLKVYEIPEGNRTTKGRAIQNLIQIESDDKVLATINVPSLDDPEFLAKHFILMCTVDGTIKKTSLEEFSRPRANGIIAINIAEGDKLLAAALADDECEVLFATRQGYANRFKLNTVRPIGRNSMGVRGIKLEGAGNALIGMIVVKNPDTQVLVLSEKGIGKRSMLEEYPTNNRGGKGVKTIQISNKTGALIGIVEVVETDELMVITRDGITIRTPVKDIRLASRATQGVKVINIKASDDIAAISKIAESEEDESNENTTEEGQTPEASTQA